MEYGLSTIKSDVEGRKRIFIATIISMVVMYLGCSRAMFSTYMPDDYLLQMRDVPLSFYMQQGRFVQAGITWVFNSLGVNIVSSSPLFLPLFFLFTSLSSSLIIDAISGDKTPLLVYLLIPAVVVSHPVFSMMSVYHLATVCFALCMACLSLLVIINEKSKLKSTERNGWKISILVILICGNYQPAIVVVGSYYLFEFIKNFKNNGVAGSVKYLMPFICGVVLYAILFKFTKTSLGENNWDNRASLVTDYHARLHDIASFLPSFFYNDWWLIPWQYAMSLSFIMVLFLFLAVIKRGGAAAVYVPAFLICILAAIAPIAALQTWDISPRSMFSVSFAYAIMIASVSDNGLFTKTKVILLVALVMLSMMVSNSYLQIVENDNIRDNWMIDRISRDLAAVGVKGEEVGFSNTNGRLSVSAWSLSALIQKRTGLVVNVNANPAIPSGVCSEANTWPNNNYIVKGPEKITVCL